MNSNLCPHCAKETVWSKNQKKWIHKETCSAFCTGDGSPPYLPPSARNLDR